MKLKPLLLALLIPMLSFGQEVNFQKDISWADAIKLAQKENKKIFVDAYTDWCYWCKVMDKKTFTDANVIADLNKNYIPVKINAEKSEGINFAAKFRISAYPTVLFFDPNGDLLKKELGYLDIEKFTVASEKVKSMTSSPYSFKGANLNPGFPDFYLNAYNPENKERPTPETVNTFLNQQTDKFGEVYWSVMSRFQLSNENKEFFLANKAKYESIYGPDETMSLIYGITEGMISEAINLKSTEKLEKTKEFIRSNFDEETVEDAIMSYEMAFFTNTEKWKELSETVDKNIASFDLNGLNSICWSIYEKCKDMMVVKKACTWMKKGLETEQNYAAADTYAALLYKAENYTEAKVWANKAIELGKKEGQKTTDTENLLLEINKKIK